MVVHTGISRLYPSRSTMIDNKLMTAPNLHNPKPLFALQSFEVTPVVFKNEGGAVMEVSVTPALPLGLKLSIENSTCVLHGTPLFVAAKTIYHITTNNSEGQHTVAIEITVSEAFFKAQRGEILHVHHIRHDLDTPRSQIENAIGDQAIMGSTIKPHEKFAQQPMGDDKRLSQQTSNNPDAENRAQNSPELTPSPSAKLQAQAVLAASPKITPTPRPGG